MTYNIVNTAERGDILPPIPIIRRPFPLLSEEVVVGFRRAYYMEYPSLLPDQPVQVLTPEGKKAEEAFEKLFAKHQDPLYRALNVFLNYQVQSVKQELKDQGYNLRQVGDTARRDAISIYHLLSLQAALDELLAKRSADYDKTKLTFSDIEQQAPTALRRVTRRNARILSNSMSLYRRDRLVLNPLSEIRAYIEEDRSSVLDEILREQYKTSRYSSENLVNNIRRDGVLFLLTALGYQSRTQSS